tara:strand:+ start:47 stop:205 length:159 start_codon:yes stop_codon:yes gene_type:complete
MARDKKRCLDGGVDHKLREQWERPVVKSEYSIAELTKMASMSLLALDGINYS